MPSDIKYTYILWTLVIVLENKVIFLVVLQDVAYFLNTEFF